MSKIPSSARSFWYDLALVWVGLALIAVFWVTGFLQGAFPIFTFLMLLVLLTVLLRKRDAGAIGFRQVGWRRLARYTGVCLVGSLALMAVFEPWSHTYQILITKAVAANQPDTTFGWLLRFPGWEGWFGFVLFAGFVTLFAEEAFFRGWVLHGLMGKMNTIWAVVLQAVLFSLPQALAAFLLPPLQGLLYASVYSWLAIGVINGWAASRTRSIWPGLISAALYNLLMTILTR